MNEIEMLGRGVTRQRGGIAEALGAHFVPADEHAVEDSSLRPRRQIAVPLMRGGRQLGVLFLDSDFDELPGLEGGAVLGEVMSRIAAAVGLAERAALPLARANVNQAMVEPEPLKVRRFARNDVIFVDGEYLIKGLAGSIFWKILTEYKATGRTDFSNLELRLDLAQRLPEKAENLESRLVMLLRRLDSMTDLRMDRVGRGKLKLLVRRPLEIIEG